MYIKTLKGERFLKKYMSQMFHDIKQMTREQKKFHPKLQIKSSCPSSHKLIIFIKTFIIAVTVKLN